MTNNQQELAEDYAQELFVNLGITRQALSDVIQVKLYLLKSLRWKL